MAVPIIDLFAGPGGLAEGFSQIGWREGNPFFHIGLSIEKERFAHRTLRLRSFLRQFRYDQIPSEYFAFLREGKSPEALLDLPEFSVEAQAAQSEAWNETLRNDDTFNAELDARIKSELKDKRDWVLIGGPPCQAYSLVGRARNRGIKGYSPEEDSRHFLYQEYLRIISVHKPAIFVMENVKGLLSAKVNGHAVFDQILRDLRKPSDDPACRYRIYSLAKAPKSFDENGDPIFEDKDFVLKAEKYGIPQARHRVILLGVREDLHKKGVKPSVLFEEESINLSKILRLPRLRSGISRGKYDENDWLKAVKDFPVNDVSGEVIRLSDKRVMENIVKAIRKLRITPEGRGGNFVAKSPTPITDVRLADWYEDLRIGGVFNHSARTHMVSDLHRYLYASCFTKAKGRSPKMAEFPEQLKPAHKNRDSGHFNDRFRVQASGKPASTVTCHISKDGHYYIHPDPSQCRSLTVREAARIQTFPDNYYFCGNRTEQYIQVGNAVPPLLANKIANIVKELLLGVVEELD